MICPRAGRGPRAGRAVYRRIYGVPNHGTLCGGVEKFACYLIALVVYCRLSLIMHCASVSGGLPFYIMWKTTLRKGERRLCRRWGDRKAPKCRRQAAARMGISCANGAHLNYALCILNYAFAKHRAFLILHLIPHCLLYKQLPNSEMYTKKRLRNKFIFTPTISKSPKYVSPVHIRFTLGCYYIATVRNTRDHLHDPFIIL